VARGARGIVIARTAERLIAVRFLDGTVEHVHPNAGESTVIHHQIITFSMPPFETGAYPLVWSIRSILRS